MAGATDLEKENLEAHVDLCQQRYEQLEGRLDKIEKKVESIHSDMIEGQKSMTKVLIGTAGTIVAGLLSTIVVILLPNLSHPTITVVSLNLRSFYLCELVFLIFGLLPFQTPRLFCIFMLGIRNMNILCCTILCAIRHIRPAICQTVDILLPYYT